MCEYIEVSVVENHTTHLILSPSSPRLSPSLSIQLSFALGLSISPKKSSNTPWVLEDPPPIHRIEAFLASGSRGQSSEKEFRGGFQVWKLGLACRSRVSALEAWGMNFSLLLCVDELIGCLNLCFTIPFKSYYWASSKAEKLFFKAKYRYLGVGYRYPLLNLEIWWPGIDNWWGIYTTACFWQILPLCSTHDSARFDYLFSQLFVDNSENIVKG